MNKTIVAGVLLSSGLLLAGCDYLDGTHEAHKAVRAQLIDPDSAQFANEKTYSRGAVCGEVNSKNRFGGYVGFTRYVYFATLVSLSPGDPDFAKYYQAFDAGSDFQEPLEQVGNACAFVSAWNISCVDPAQKDAERRATRQCNLYLSNKAVDTNKLRAEVGAPPESP